VDDPNPLQHKYSYDFTFADGTRRTGTSDDNTVAVVVAGASFDLHVSCSDEFADGYGEKGGPSAGIWPVQHPVVEFKIWKYADAGSGSCELKGTCAGPGGNPDGDGAKKPKPKKQKKKRTSGQA
jgi:hypothetical protein